jgi:hypothetical protein
VPIGIADLETRRDYYKGVINYEQILGTHITKMSQYRDSNLKQYCSSVETFILMCPKNIRTKSLEKLKELGLKRGVYHSITDDKLSLYDELWCYANEQLERENLIFKSGTFEIGHD